LAIGWKRERQVGAWDDRLMRVGSELRAKLLLDACEDSGVKTARALLADWFNTCDAIAPYAEGLRAQFERVGYVTDNPAAILPLPVTIYRAQWGGDPEPAEALSWTASRETAQWFADYLTSPRAQFLGIVRDDAACIWQATVRRAGGRA
jgi:hypothetical protein